MIDPGDFYDLVDVIDDRVNRASGVVVVLQPLANRFFILIRTLSYVDNLNLAPWIKCRTIISNGLCDDICPPSTIFAVYHHISAEKKMEIYPFHKHEIPYEHNELKFRLLMEALRP